ncbi:MAG: ATP-binding protein [Gammaproteobacteria bacterium]|nr:ATP-binding protein [Gammaproteobacteria bacterium]
MNNQYFLTRQTANLMEDFLREISCGSTLFLLYGDTGVGKTSLLKQLTTQRLTEMTCHWIDFSESDDAEALQRIAELANAGDVIIVDHFDSASNRAQHQIFKSWSTEGRDKALNMIVSTTSSSFSIFRQLAQQYQVEAQSFQLMPCRAEEVESYLQFALFPDASFGQLEISPAVRKQIRNARGVFAKLNEIIGREADAFRLEAGEHKLPVMSVGLISGLFLLVLIGAGLVYYFYPLPPARLESNKPEVVASAEVVEESAQRVIIEIDWFQRILDQSIEWVKQEGAERGTIQIMTVGYERFDKAAFRIYLDGLQAKDVDIDKIKVFITLAGLRVVYSITYGEYLSRREASRQIAALSEALGADSPIPRTAGGIAGEITQLEGN